MKKIVSVLLLATMLLSFCACMSATPKEFSAEGMTMTLTSAFKENTQQGYTVCYDSKDVAVFVLKESFSLMQGAKDLTLQEYAELVKEANKTKNPSDIKEENGLTTFEYSFLNEELNQTYTYFCATYKASDAFWLVQFACLESKYDNYQEKFVEWAKTVSFDA